jgi:hypothetical protein
LTGTSSYNGGLYLKKKGGNMNPTNKMTDSSFFRTQDLIRSKQGKYNAFVKKLDKQKETHEKPSWLSVIVNWFKK